MFLLFKNGDSYLFHNYPLTPNIIVNSIHAVVNRLKYDLIKT